MKIIDPDRDLETEADQHPAVSWEFDLALSNATTEDDEAQFTDDSGRVGWEVSFDPGSASATLTEDEVDGLELLHIECLGSGDTGDTLPGLREGNSITFDLDLPNATIMCTFFNAPISEIPLAGISVWKHIDTDGDLDSFGDREWPPSWQFDAEFEEGVEIVSADPDTDRDKPAGWVIAHSGGSTRVVVTEVPQDGYRILAASCIDADSSDGMEIPTTLEGNSLSFEVSGFSDLNIGPHGYFCDFFNAPVNVGALPTLPPTDAATSTAATGSDEWRLVMVGLAALIAGILVVRPRPAARSGT